jgi:predicted HAD superfamily phosphohydrolase
MNKQPEKKKITRIEKRSIEVQAIAPVIEMVSKKIGKEEALEVLKEVNQQEAFKRGQSTVRTAGLSTIEELVKDVSTWGDGQDFRERS